MQGLYEGSEDVGQPIITPVGRGMVQAERLDGVYVVKYPFGTGYIPRMHARVEKVGTVGR